MLLRDNSGMVLVNEWLPNPKGNDAKGEWIELLNTGREPVLLDGWRLTADGKKFFTLHGTLAPGAYLVVPRAESKLTLKNTDGRLALYDASGRLADQASFQGAAPEGESANRTQAGTFFGKPTPGVANAVARTNAIVYNNQYPLGVPIGPAQAAAASAPQFVGFLLGTALALAAAVVFIFKSHEDLSHLFFPRDQDARRGGR